MPRPFAALALASAVVATAGCGGGSSSGSQRIEPATTAGSSTGAAPGTAATTPGGVPGNPAAGKVVFGSSGCGGCHTLREAGASGTIGPNLDQARPSYDLIVERVTSGRSPMPSFKGRLSEQQIRDVAAYVVAATHGG